MELLGNTSTAMRRITNERKQIEENPPIHWKIQQYKWNQWIVWITAPITTPYHTIPFKLIVAFPQEYPFSKPTLRLENYERFFHPNINKKDGYICQQTLKSKQISMTARERIEAFVTLLGVPNPDNPFNLQAANLFKQNQKKYYKKALHIFRGYKKVN